jgi:hypothetical protein
MGGRGGGGGSSGGGSGGGGGTVDPWPWRARVSESRASRIRIARKSTS